MADIKSCDLCGGTKSVNTQNVFVDTYMDAAGSSSSEYQRVDLCGTCAHRVLKELFEKSDYEKLKAWLFEMMRKQMVKTCGDR